MTISGLEAETRSGTTQVMNIIIPVDNECHYGTVTSQVKLVRGVWFVVGGSIELCCTCVKTV